MKCLSTSNKIYLILILCLLLKKSNSHQEKKSLEQQPSFYYGPPGLDEASFSTPLMVKSLRDPSIMIEPLIREPQLSRTIISHKSVVPEITPPFCPCASLVKCTPCSMVPVVKKVVVNCPCAPKLVCPVCPPVSTLHKLAAKKTKEDQKNVLRLRGLTKDINKILDDFTTYSEQVIKFENKAKEAAEKMEQASLKADFARKHMIQVSEQAREVAKQTICYGC